MSPELLNPDLFGFEDSRPTKESDCYALGMVVLEVLSGRAPFAPDKDFIVMRKSQQVDGGTGPGVDEDDSNYTVVSNVPRGAIRILVF